MCGWTCPQGLTASAGGSARRLRVPQGRGRGAAGPARPGPGRAGLARSTPAARYVHGGFEGTHTLFSFYFPPAEQYRGRFVQYQAGGSGGHETLLPFEAWTFPVAFDDLGCYLLESNQGHYPNEGMGFADDWELSGASAHCALYAKELAAEVYGEPPHHGYVFGGSGGGSRSIYCLENRPEVYDGASPHVIWSSPLGSNWSPIGYWWLHARDMLPQIIDAMEPTPHTGCGGWRMRHMARRRCSARR